MAIQFREKARMAYETMPRNQKSKVAQVIEQLNIDKAERLDSRRLKNEDLDAWVVRIDHNVRLLYRRTDQGFLIMDIIDRNKDD
uniref:Plasmid stabilization system n=1 Tax=Cyanothece sp. (strain PCC 7425 / ATCC 29141) TaxID=395961 RepID=B8HR02_CYAP4